MTIPKIVYTPYVASFRTDTPKESISFDPIPTSIVSYSSPKREESRPAVKSEEPVYTQPEDTQPVTTPIRGNVTYASDRAKSIGNMQSVIDAFLNAGISIHVTSGVRPGAMTTSGRRSQHSTGDAIDITPGNGETWESLRKKVKESPELSKFLKDNGYDILDETIPSVMARTGATGPHWHVHKRRDIASASKGLKFENIFRMQKGNKFPIYYNPYNKDNSKQSTDFVDNFYDTYTETPRFNFEGYKKEYSLTSEEPTREQITVQKPDVPQEDEHYWDDLYRFTESFESFSPEAFQLKDADGKMSWYIGYGSANKDLLAKRRITKQEAHNQVVNDFKEIEKVLRNRIKNWDLLDKGVKYAMMDTAYNGGVYGFISKSPNLMKMLDAGITDGRLLAKELNHSQSMGGSLTARSKERQR